MTIHSSSSPPQLLHLLTLLPPTAPAVNHRRTHVDAAPTPTTAPASTRPFPTGAQVDSTRFRCPCPANQRCPRFNAIQVPRSCKSKVARSIRRDLGALDSTRFFSLG
ncbi:hypothetical protein ACS0TY_028076 [Phlomoides rotata]